VSPVYDLIFSAIRLVPTEVPGEILLACPFCNDGIALVTLPDEGMEFGDLLGRGRHECSGADDSLRHVIHRRGRSTTGRFVLEYLNQKELADAARVALINHAREGDL
jgi:hypothetical protein